MPIVTGSSVGQYRTGGHELRERHDHRVIDLIAVGPAQTPLGGGLWGGESSSLSRFSFLYNEITTNL